MDEEYMVEDLAEEAINEIKKVIDLDRVLVNREHNFIENLHHLGYIVLHLNERIPHNASELQSINNDVEKELARIIEFLEKSELKNLRIERGEEGIAADVNTKLKFHKLRAVVKQKRRFFLFQKKFRRLHIVELRQLHIRFRYLRTMIDRRISKLRDEYGQDKLYQQVKKYIGAVYQTIQSYEFMLEDFIKVDNHLKRH